MDNIRQSATIVTTSLINLQLLSAHCNFYDWKSKNKYIQPMYNTCNCCPYDIIFIIGNMFLISRKAKILLAYN